VASETVDLVSGDVRALAGGFRNPFDVVVHSNGNVYALDNGPNLDSGPASATCDSEGPEPYEPDELNFIEEGEYYGSPNRNRARSDPRECTYVSGRDTSGLATPPIAKLGLGVVPGGLFEYTSDAFGGALRGDLIYVEWGDPRRVMRAVLSDDGTAVTSIAPIAEGPLARPLDATMGPDGTIYLAEWEGKQIGYLRPVEP
jgi:glucose/arabinose dehydrogenase